MEIGGVSMTKDDVIEIIKDVTWKDFGRHPDFPKAREAAIQALNEVEEYRAIGTPEELQDMKNNYFEALSDWRQYRKIGTLEECRTAVEKQTARKVTTNHSWTHYHFFCPVCNMEVNDMKYCPNCGQKLDWSDEE